MAGEQENSIGTARAYLDIDATGWDQAVARAKNSAAGLGTAAEQAFDTATKAQQRAATQLILFGRTTDEVTAKQAALNAVAKGAPVAVAQAWAKAVQEQFDATAKAAAEQAKLNALMEQAIGINREYDIQRAASAQAMYNQLLGVGSGAPNMARRADAESAFTDGMAAQEAAEAARIDALAAALKARDEAAMESAATSRKVAATYEAETVATNANTTATAANATEKRAAAAMTAAQQAELGKLMGQIDPLTAKLNKLDALQRSLNDARAKGRVSTDDYAAYNAVIEKNRAAVMGAAGAVEKLNFNTAQARREYGYLIKDVATGQWGRFEQSAATLANNIGGLGIKFLALLGTVALVTAAFINFEKEHDKFVTSVAEGNGLSGTIDDLEALAKTLGGQEGNTFSDARTAVEGLAKAGLLVGENLQLAAKAATDWASTTGQSADTVTSKFNAIATDPLKAIENGTVRITEAQYESIQTLMRMGMQQQAVNEVTRLYYDQIESNNEMVKANLSGFTQYWHEIRDATKAATQSVADYFNAVLKGAAQPMQRSKDWGYAPEAALRSAPGVGQIYEYLLGKEAGNQPKNPGALNWITGNTPSEFAGPPTILTPQQLAAQKEIAKIYDESGTAAEKYGKAVSILNGQLNGTTDAFLKTINVTRNADGSFSGEGYQQMLTSISKRTGLTAANKPKGLSDDNAAIKADAAAQQAQIATQTAFVQGQYELRQITIEDYYDKVKQLATDSTNVQVAMLRKEITADQAKGASQAKIAALQSQILKAQQDGSKKQQELDNQETKAIDQRTQAIEAFAQAQQAQTTSLQRSLDAMVAKVGMGQQEYEIAQKINQIYNEQADTLAKLALNYQHTHDKVSYDADVAVVMEETSKRIDAVTASYVRLNAEQTNVFNGMQAAWADFGQKSMMLSDNLQSVWTSGLSSIGDAAAKTATGVGTSFSDMAKQIEATAIRTLTNAAVTKFIQMVASMFGGSAYSGLSGNGTGGYGMQMQNSYGSGGMFQFNAKGGAYASSDLASHMNSIVSSPTLFKFAKGSAFGVMGEAGNEAIMPLSRDSNGVLGVRNYAGGQQGMPVVNVNIIGAQSKPEVNSKPNGKGGIDVDVLFKQIDQGMASGIAAGTSATSVALRKRYGK